MKERIRTIALTIGHPNGIGPEIAVKAAAQLRGNGKVHGRLDLGSRGAARPGVERAGPEARPPAGAT